MVQSRQIVAYNTIVRKEVLRFMRIWIQTILPPVITILLYFLIFGAVIGSQIDDISGYSYIDFIVPGLIMMSVIINSYSNVVSSFFQAKMFKNLEEMIVSPVNEVTIILGYITGGVLRGLIIAFFVTLVSLFFTDLEVFNLYVIFSVVILTAILFSLAGLLNGIFSKGFDSINIVPIFVLTPLTYLGGVFYSISQLGVYWQYASLANPILYMVNVFRYGFLGISDVNIYFAFFMIVFFIVVLFVLSYYLLKKGVGVRS